MRLEIGETIIERPTALDVRRAIPDRAPSTDWSIALIRDDTSSIEAEGRPDGRYAVSFVEGRRLFDGVQPLDASALRRTFERYAAGDERWRDEVEWKAYVPAPTPAWSGGGLLWRPSLRWGLIVPAAAVALWLAVSGIGSLPPVRLPNVPLPAFVDSVAARLILGFFALCTLVFCVAALAKIVEVRRAARWPTTKGRIVRSEPGFRMVRASPGSMPDSERVAEITYEYEVERRTLRGTRVCFAEKTCPEDEEARLAKYPVGQIVDVYYDPANPARSVLERDPPVPIGLGCLAFFALGVAGLIVVMWAATHGDGLVRRVLPKSHPVVLLIAGLGAVTATGVLISQIRAVRAASSWPRTIGTIVRSEVAEHLVTGSGGRGSTGQRRVSQPVVEYRYTVAGRPQVSRSIWLDSTRGGSRGFAEAVSARYPVGSTVTVRYDPVKPGRAALELGLGLTWVLAPISLLLWGATIWATGLLG